MPEAADAQPADANYDESKVPDYTLPDPLMLTSGGRVETSEQWRERRRPEVLRLFETEMYGRTPDGLPPGLRSEVISTEEEALGGPATRKQIRILFNGDPSGPKMDLLLYLPTDAEGPVPVFLGLNFQGNHTVSTDPGIRLPEGADEADRGKAASRWPIEAILGRGYGVATA